MGSRTSTVFTNKLDGQILCAKSRAGLSFDRFFVHQSQKFKILAIPDVLAHEKSYEHGFMKRHDGHKHCAKLHSEWSFERFFMHRLRNLKYWPFPTY
ncbi:hypothetical protein BHM03_00043518 [Ensete ventricosum]|nr:hypothetical protein BHM03_00043518 [Ensete ventricosum]